jgi:hypothetical protein
MLKVIKGDKDYYIAAEEDLLKPLSLEMSEYEAHIWRRFFVSLEELPKESDLQWEPNDPETFYDGPVPGIDDE